MDDTIYESTFNPFHHIPKDQKLTIGIIYGGRSGEHEVSLRSAKSAFTHLDRERFIPILIYIDRLGRFYRMDESVVKADSASLPTTADAPGAHEIILLPRPINDSGEQNRAAAKFVAAEGSQARSFFIHVAMLMVHGTNGEDGTLQGLLDLVQVPYTGCGVLASAICMDKLVAKQLCEAHGVPVVPYTVLLHTDDQASQETLQKEMIKTYGLPLFVKAAGQGSSLGVYKAKTEAELAEKVAEAFKYDTKVLIEKSIDAREIEFALLDTVMDGHETTYVSPPAEIIPTHEFYTYEAKYHDEKGAEFKIPAEITDDQLDLLEELALNAYLALQCEGYARVDLFLDRKTNEVYFNEINTLPGFTSISMFPRMIQDGGIEYPDLLTEMIDHALKRGKVRAAIKRER